MAAFNEHTFLIRSEAKQEKKSKWCLADLRVGVKLL